MNQNITTNLKVFCSNCGCEESKFIHNVWYGEIYQRLCTSCVLFTCKEYFCPTCFGVHGLESEGKLICCESCNSRSHPVCFSSNQSQSGAPPMCSSCVNPKTLIFNPKELKLQGFDQSIQAVDEKAILLLSTAAKLGGMLMCREGELSEARAEVAVAMAVMHHEKAKLGVIHAMKDHDLKNKDRNVDSLLDFSNNDDDSSCETLSDSGRMQRLRIEGEVSESVPKEIDLNEKGPRKDDAI